MKKDKVINEQKAGNQDINIQYLNTTTTLVNIAEGVYTYEFLKSMSNIQTTSDILPLVIDKPSHVHATYELVDDMITITYHVDQQDATMNTIRTLLKYEQLQVLKNIKFMFHTSKQGYTYILHPDNLVYSVDYMPKCIYVGYDSILEPIKQSEEQLLYQYKCLIFSVLEKSFDFDKLLNGELEYCKKTTFLSKVYKAESVSDVIVLIENAFEEEKKQYLTRHIAVRKNRYQAMRLTSLVASIVAVLSLILAIYSFVVKLPYEQLMNEASKYYISEDYGNVIKTLYKESPESLPQTQRYILAYSYILEEPMQKKSKDSALNVLRMNSDERYLNYWIYLGRMDYESALEISKVLTDLNLEYHATYRAIEIIKASDSISGQEKETKIKEYTGKLETLEKQLFGDDAKEEQTKGDTNGK